MSERTREIGTLRSLGFLRREIVAMFAVEAALLALLSSAIGLAVTLCLRWVINGAGIAYKAGMLSDPVPLGIAVLPAVYAMAAGFLSAIAVLAALVPARHAARMKIPDAMGHV